MKLQQQFTRLAYQDSAIFKILNLVVLTLFCGNAWSIDPNCNDVEHNIDFSVCSSGSMSKCTYRVEDGVTVTSQSIAINSLQSGDTAEIRPGFTNCADNTNPADPASIICMGILVERPQPPNYITRFYGDDTGVINDNSTFTLRATRGASTCDRDYGLLITSSPSGWGDPHITTVDKVHYDFQSAGEFTTLRGNDIEIQARQTAYPNNGPLFANPYTGISSCVAVYTAVATKVGRHRVTFQPNISGEPDPSGMQLRIDGVLAFLGPEGINLDACNCGEEGERTGQKSGRILRTPDQQGVEIQYPNGTRLVLTPRWIESRKMWYLQGVQIFDTTADKGIMGRIANGSWLPALSNGETVGQKAEDMHDRYVQLYKTFSDSWRVNDENSLFDYAPGTSTATFTLAEWPRENPTSCQLTEPSGDGTPQPAAIIPAIVLNDALIEEKCAKVEDENNRENCKFDVAVTGEIDFADAYVLTEQATPGATTTVLSSQIESSKPGMRVSFSADVSRKATAIAKISAGNIQFVLDGKNVGTPVNLDLNGKAEWVTTELSRGNHEVQAFYLPTGFGESFRPSKSATLNHYVSYLGPNLGLSFHAGPNFPVGRFGKSFNQGFSTQIDAEYRLDNLYSLVGLYGYNQFKGESGIDDTHWSNLSADFKYYFKTGPQTLWFMLGLGSYNQGNGSSKNGSNYGMGYMFYRTPQIRAEVGINSHTIHTDEGNIQFYNSQVGVIYSF